MEIQIPLIATTAPMPLNPSSFIEIAVPDVSSATGYTTCKVLLSNIGIEVGKKYACNLKQATATSTPTINELVNTTSVTPTISRTAPGAYKMTFLGLFTDSNKLHMPPFVNGEDARFTFIPLSDVTGIIGYYTIRYFDIDTILIQMYDNTFAAADLKNLCGANCNLPINFTVYP